MKDNVKVNIDDSAGISMLIGVILNFDEPFAGESKVRSNVISNSIICYLLGYMGKTHGKFSCTVDLFELVSKLVDNNLSNNLKKSNESYILAEDIFQCVQCMVEDLDGKIVDMMSNEKKQCTIHWINGIKM